MIIIILLRTFNNKYFSYKDNGRLKSIINKKFV